ncbi:hypothetical protein BC938DRAFT_471616, partial [Jimgerdemannia flammicorona]
LRNALVCIYAVVIFKDPPGPHLFYLFSPPTTNHRMNLFNGISAGLGCVTVVIVLVFMVASTPLHIYNIVNAVNGLETYPDKEPCQGGNNLHIFLIGVIVCSSLSLLMPLPFCCSGCNSNAPVTDGVPRQNSTESTSCGLTGLFQLVWAILGTVWFSDSHACQTDFPAIYDIAMRSLIILWIGWAFSIVLLVLICSTGFCLCLGSARSTDNE